MINYGHVFLTFLIALAISFLFTPLMRKIALKKRIVDKPGKGKVHTKPVPLLGGVAIYLAFVLAILLALCLNPALKEKFSLFFIGLFFGGLVLVILGIYDDMTGVTAFPKFIIQIFAASILFYYGFRIEFITNPFGGLIHFAPLPSLLITIFWIVALTNAINLIDGLDGLAAGIVSIVSLALLSIALYRHDLIGIFLALALAGSCLGFLKFNFYPAKIFMGDTGSMFLGFVLAAIGITGIHKSATAAALLIPIVALGIPVYDTLVAIIRRSKKRTYIFKGDKEHLHHRLLNIGLSYRGAVISLYFACFFCGIIAFLFVLIPKEYALIILVLLAMGIFATIRTIGFVERRLRRNERKKRKSR